MLDEHYTVDEFAEMEMTTPFGERWELIHGRIWRNMTGGTVAHNQIAQNIAFAVRTKLRAIGSPCRVFTENVKFEEATQETVVYPDVIVTCEEVRNQSQKIVSPTILVEVVSRSSGLRDRREKLAVYSRIPSVQNYVVVEQLQPIVEFWSRSRSANNAEWSAHRVEGLGIKLEFSDFNISIALVEIYDRVFDASPSQSSTSYSLLDFPSDYSACSVTAQLNLK